MSNFHTIGRSRYLMPTVKRFLKRRMVFIGGPRQVGKTTLSLQLLGGVDAGHPAYLNWDAPGVASRIRQAQLPLSEPLIVLDEIHKYRNWRNLMKGLFDTHKHSHQFLVTGSARLDHYRRGGDSLLGRYHYLRLHPLSWNELRAPEQDLTRLLVFGGFPEPFFAQDPDFHRLWLKERRTRLVREDLRDLERVHEIDSIEHLAEVLPSKVGSLLSIEALREDLQVDHKTVARWLSMLEQLYDCFRISSYGPPKIRALKKRQKLYLWDWSAIKDHGLRFENLVASQLLKYCHFREDTEGYAMELRYLRDQQGHEVDFVVIKEGRPLFAVECKTKDKQISKNIRYFQKRTDIPQFYQVHTGTESFVQGNLTLLPFTEFCEQQSMP